MNVLGLSRSFPSLTQSKSQSLSKCEIFVLVISSNFNMNVKTDFHNKDFARRLALKQRLK